MNKDLRSSGWHRLLWMSLLSWLFSAGLAKAEVVYQNTLGATNYFLFTREYGDEINLAGTARYVNEIRILYSAAGAAAGSAPGQYRVRFYANDGTLFSPNQPSTQRPRTVLWQSELFNVVSSAPNATLATIAVPNILVPDKFTWTVEFLNMTQVATNGAGLVIANPVSVGAELPGQFNPVIGSYGDFWVRREAGNDNSWALSQVGSQPVNFYIQVNAVPEPAVVALGTLGVAAVLWQARRRMRSGPSR